MNRSKLFFLSFVLFIVTGIAQKKAPAAVKPALAYETVAGDPLKARIYTLPNGLKVYMSIYKDAPRIQTLIAVKAGSKNDPKDATGLAHYLEHMLFKGTDKYGSLDYKKEKPLLDKIESLYEVYRKTTDDAQRRKIYRQIDSISGIAAKYAIANEFDKMTAAIGCEGTNAFTSFEQTVYVNDIPSNQLENWLTIEAERFRNPVMRIFHTELEAVYEEKNMSLDRDDEKVWDGLFSGMFRKHTYGTQTTIGTIAHLKNPSITEIKKYYSANYVPNNMAIILSGDFDPDKTIQLIAKKFGYMKPKPVVPFTFEPEQELNSPVVKEAVGPEAESVSFGFRFGGAATADPEMLKVIATLLYNGKAGLLDLNLNKKQLVLDAGANEYLLKDYSCLFIDGYPKEGQTLEEVRDLLLGQLEELKKGNFPDWMLSAVVNQMKLEKIRRLESNYGRAREMLDAFVKDCEWKKTVEELNRINGITKQQVVDFANKYIRNNYVVVFKRLGEDKNVVKVEKPQITPVEVNRDKQSPFLQKIVNSNPPPIAPVFTDYEKDIRRLALKNGLNVHYNKNEENETFQLYYVYDIGRATDPLWPVAIQYLKYLGTSRYSSEQIAQEFFKIGCSFDVFCGEDRLYVTLSGLSENFTKGLELFEHLLKEVKPDDVVLQNMVSDILKDRADAKLNKEVILYQAMVNYGKYGARNPFTEAASEDQLKQLKGEQLVKLIQQLSTFDLRVLYYGGLSTDDLTAAIERFHNMEVRNPVPAMKDYEVDLNKNKVYVVDFEMKQADIVMLAKGQKYDPAVSADLALYNEYFGGGMSSIVFQDLRESKALAYSAGSRFSAPDKKDRYFINSASIGTQADKLPEAMAGMMALLREMPKSEVQFKAAKSSVVQRLRTDRINKSWILFDYEDAMRLGLKENLRKYIYDKVQKMELKDVAAFQEKNVKNMVYTTLVLGKKSELDIKTLEKYGEVKFLDLKDVFGY